MTCLFTRLFFIGSGLDLDVFDTCFLMLSISLSSYMAPLAPLRLIFGLRKASVKIGGSAFVSSNSKNISYVTFLKHKIAENRELALWHLVNRLVPENA
jgi:hypothetical protein